MKLKLSWLRPYLSAVLAVSYLGTQCVFAYQPEKGFWTERRKSAQRQSSTLLASVPVGHTAFKSLAQQFPSTQPVSPTLSPSVAQSVPKGFIKDHAPLLSALSPSYGSIRKVCLPKPGSPPGPLILHIQDVHMNADAQRNIGETVRALMDSGQVDLIALEGSTEEINLQPFADTPHRQAVQMTADFLLRENKISGPIHAALTHAGQLPRILGIDDPVHYEANVQAYRTSAPTLEKARQEMKGFEWEMEAKKKTAYSPALFAYDQKVQAYRAGRVSLGEYVKTLAPANEPGQSNLMAGSSLSPSIRSFLDALTMEQTLDFKKVESERTRLLERLTRALTPEETNALLAGSLAYRSGQLRYADFYGQLKTTCQKNGIPLNEFPSMDAYVRYVLLADKIDAERLLEDIGALENTGYTWRIKTAEEKKLVSRARQLWLTTKLVDFSLIPSEWKEYQTGDKLDRLHSFESFYVEAQARDTAMASNLLRAIKEAPKKSAGTMTILVTGGYHAEGMAQQLTAQGATVISYVPKIEKIDTAQGAAYLSVFTQEKTPLEKLVQGEKLFLAINPASSSLRKTFLPALFVMVLIGLLGNISGIDPNAVYHAMGGVGILALGKIMKDSVDARLSVGNETANIHVGKNGGRVQSVNETVIANRATGWIGVIGAYLFGWVKGAVKQKFIHSIKRIDSPHQFAMDYVKENDGHRAAVAEDVISSLVLLTIGIWTTLYVGSPTVLDWKSCFPFLLAISWPIALFLSHIDPKRFLQSYFQIESSQKQALKLIFQILILEAVVILFCLFLPTLSLLFSFVALTFITGVGSVYLRWVHQKINMQNTSVITPLLETERTLAQRILAPFFGLFGALTTTALAWAIVFVNEGNAGGSLLYSDMVIAPLAGIFFQLLLISSSFLLPHTLRPISAPKKRIGIVLTLASLYGIAITASVLGLFDTNFNLLSHENTLIFGIVFSSVALFMWPAIFGCHVLVELPWKILFPSKSPKAEPPQQEKTSLYLKSHLEALSIILGIYIFLGGLSGPLSLLHFYANAQYEIIQPLLDGLSEAPIPPSILIGASKLFLAFVSSVFLDAVLFFVGIALLPWFFSFLINIFLSLFTRWTAPHRSSPIDSEIRRDFNEWAKKFQTEINWYITPKDPRTLAEFERGVIIFPSWVSVESASKIFSIVRRYYLPLLKHELKQKILGRSPWRTYSKDPFVSFLPGGLNSVFIWSLIVLMSVASFIPFMIWVSLQMVTGIFRSWKPRECHVPPIGTQWNPT